MRSDCLTDALPTFPTTRRSAGTTRAGAGEFRRPASRPHEDHRPRAPRARASAADAGGDDVRSPSFARAAARQGAAAADDEGAEARGAQPGGHAGRRGRPLHARAVALGSRDVRSHSCSSNGCTSSRSGSARTSCSATTAPAPSPCSDRWARATGFAPRRSIRSATRISSSAARGSGGWSPRDASTRRARCSAITTSSTAPSRAAPAADASSGFRPPTSRPCNELVPPTGVYATTGHDRRRRASVDHKYRHAAHVRRRRPAGDRDPRVRRRRAICTASHVRLSFVQRLRDERAFPDVDALRAQIEADCRGARRLFGRISL